MSFKRILALVLALTMCFSIVYPGGVAFAAEPGQIVEQGNVVDETNENSTETLTENTEETTEGNDTTTVPETVIPETPTAEEEEQNEDEPVVPTVDPVVAMVGEAEFTSFADALAYVRAHADEVLVIVLMADVTEKVELKAGESLKVLAGSFSISVVAADGIELTASEPDENGVVTYTAMVKIGIRSIKLNENGVMTLPESSTTGESAGGTGTGLTVTPNYVASIGEQGYETLQAALNAAQNGDTVKVLVEGSYAIPSPISNVIIEGLEDNTKVIFSSSIGSGNFANTNGKVTLRNVTLTFLATGDYKGFQHPGNLTFENCVINGYFSSYGDMTFKNCVFNQTESEYAMWVYGGGTVVYDGCTFNMKGKTLNLYQEASENHVVYVNNCKFYSDRSNKAALNVKATCNSTPLHYTVYITNSTANANFPVSSSSDKLVVLNPIVQVDDIKDSVDSQIFVYYDQTATFSYDGNGNPYVSNPTLIYPVPEAKAEASGTTVTTSIDSGYFGYTGAAGEDGSIALPQAESSDVKVVFNAAAANAVATQAGDEKVKLVVENTTTASAEDTETFEITFVKVVGTTETPIFSEEVTGASVEVTVPYTGTSPYVNVYVVSGGVKTPVEVKSVDTTNHTLTFIAKHFSTYTLEWSEDSVASYVQNGVTVYTDDLAYAFANADADSIVTLLADVTAGDIAVSKNLTFDLSGNTLTIDPAAEAAFLINSKNVVFTLQDSGTGGKIYSATDGLIGIYATGNNTTVNLVSGAITLTGSGTEGIESTKGTINMSGGSITASAGIYNPAGCNAYISGGTITGSTYAVQNVDGGVLTINSNTSVPMINGPLFSTYADKLPISGGVFTADPGDFAANGYIAWTNDNATYIWTVLPAVTVTFDAGEGATVDGINRTVSFEVATGKSFASAPVSFGYEVPTASKAASVFNGWDGFNASTPISDSVTYKAEWSVATASVTHNGVTTNYENLLDAYNHAAAGDTITLLADDYSLADGGELKINKAITIDGDGNTIFGQATNNGYNDIFIKAGAGDTVTIKNVTLRQFGSQKSTASGHAPIWVSTSNAADVVIDNVTVQEFNRTGIYLGGGNCTVTGCYINCYKSTDYGSVMTKGVETHYGVVATVENTTIVGATSTYSEWTTSGIEIYGTGDVVIDGCTIESLTNGIAISDVVAAQGGDLGQSNVTVKNSTISATACALDNSTDSAVMNVESGTYEGEIYSRDGNDGGMAISGGTFDHAVPDEYCADGFVPSEAKQDASGNTYYTVDEAYCVQFTVDGVKVYSTNIAQDDTRALNSVELLAAADAAEDAKGDGYTFAKWTWGGADFVTSTEIKHDYILTATFTEDLTLGITVNNGNALVFNNTAVSAEVVGVKGGQTVVTYNPSELTLTWYAKNGENWDSLEVAPKNAGSYKLHVNAAAKGGYTAAEGDKEFTITKAPITPTFTITDWVAGNGVSTLPVVTGNSGNGDLTYEYKAAEGDYAAFTVDGSKTIPAGTYSLKVSVAETANYKSGTATADFTVTAAVAKIGTTYYATLAAAIDAVEALGEGDTPAAGNATTIEMVAATTESVTIPVGKNIVLDLAGKTITGESGSNTIEINGTLTVKDTVGNGLIEDSGTAPMNGTLYANGGTLYVESGKITGNGTLSSRAVIYVKNGTAQISGGEIVGAWISNNSSTVSMTGTVKYNGKYSDTVTTSGGYFTNEISSTNLAPGYGCFMTEADPDYPYQVLELTEENSTAKVVRNDELVCYYQSVKDALSAALDGDKVVILQDSTGGQIIYATDKAVTLDLNGKSYTVSTQVTTLVLKNGSLTITDTSAGSNGKLISSIDNAIQVQDGASLTISGGTVQAANRGIFAIGTTDQDNPTTVSITGGTVTAAGEGTIITNGSYDPYTTISISGGTVSNTGTGTSAIYNPNRGTTINISGDAVITGPTGIALKGGALNVSGGSISGTGAYTAPAAVSSGSTSTGDAVYVEDTYSTNGNNFKPTVNITGGTLRSISGYAAQYWTNATESTASQANGKIEISGSTVTLDSTKIPNAINSSAIEDKVDVYGGSFEDPVRLDECADGYYPVAIANNRFSVSNQVVALVYNTTNGRNNGLAYATIEDAFDNAASGDVIEIIKNTTLTSTITVPAGKTLTLDLNGKTVTAYDDADKRFVVNGDLTLTDLSTNGGGKILDATVADSSGKTNAAMVKVDGDGKLTVAAKATIEGHNYAVAVFGSGMLDVYGTVTSVALSAISTNGNKVGTSANVSAYTKITINDGAVVTSNDIAVYLPAGELTVNGGTITGATGIYAKGGKLTVPAESTAVVTGNGAHADFVHSGNGANATGDALVVENTTGYEYSPATISVAGGTFVSEKENTVAVSSFAYGNGKTPVKNFVSGGSFSSQVPLEYCATSYMPSAKGADNMYGVEPGTGVARIGEVYYTSLQEAVDAIGRGTDTDNYASGTIELLKNIELSAPVIIPNVGSDPGEAYVDITINGGGYKIYGEYSASFNRFFDGKSNTGLRDNVHLTVNNVAFENTNTNPASNSVKGFVATTEGTDVPTNNLQIAFNGCSFTNFYTSVYVSPAKQGVSVAGRSLSITDCTYDNVNYAYSVDTSCGYVSGEYDGSGALQISEQIAVTLTGSSGYTAEREVFEKVQVGSLVYMTFAKGAAAAATSGETLSFVPNKTIEPSDTFTLPVGQTLKVAGGGSNVVVNPAEGYAADSLSKVTTGEGTAQTTTYSYKTMVAEVNGVKYPTLAGAVAATADNDTVTMIANDPSTDEIAVNYNITIAGGTFDVTGQITVAAGKTLTITGGVFEEYPEKDEGALLVISGGYFPSEVAEADCADTLAPYGPIASGEPYEGLYTVKGGVAMIGDRLFSTLANAVEAAEKDDTIILIADDPETGDINVTTSITIKAQEGLEPVPAVSGQLIAKGGTLRIESGAFEQPEIEGGAVRISGGTFHTNSFKLYDAADNDACVLALMADGCIPVDAAALLTVTIPADNAEVIWTVKSGYDAINVTTRTAYATKGANVVSGLQDGVNAVLHGASLVVLKDVNLYFNWKKNYAELMFQNGDYSGTLRSMDGRKYTLTDCGAVSGSASTEYYTVKIAGGSNVVFENLTIVGCQSSGCGKYVVNVVNGSKGTLDNVNINTVKGSAIGVEATGSAGRELNLYDSTITGGIVSPSGSMVNVYSGTYPQTAFGTYYTLHGGTFTNMSLDTVLAHVAKGNDDTHADVVVDANGDLIVFERKDDVPEEYSTIFAAIIESPDGSGGITKVYYMSPDEAFAALKNGETLHIYNERTVTSATNAKLTALGQSFTVIHHVDGEGSAIAEYQPDYTAKITPGVGLKIAAASAAEGGKTYTAVVDPETAQAMIVADGKTYPDDGVYYPTLANAISAVTNGDTIYVMQNIDYGTSYLTLNKNATYTIDLNGKTISSSTNTYSRGTFYFTAGTVDVIGDGNVIASKNSSPTQSAVYVNGSSAVVNLKGGNFKGSYTGTSTYYYGYAVDRSNGTVNISGGFYEGSTADLYGTASYIKVTGGVFKHSPVSYVDQTKYAIVSYTDGTHENWYTLAPAVAINTTTTTGTSYPGLAEAVAAAQDGDTITILKNFTIDASKTAATDRIVVDKAVTIDFGEYTMSVPGELEPTSNWAALYVDADTTITATTGGINCLDKESGGCGVYGINVRNGAKLTIEGGVYHGGGTIVQVQNGSAEIKGGTFTATAYDEPYGMNFVLNCIDASYPNEAAFDVSGGTFVGFDPQASKAEPGDPADLTAEGYVAIEDAEHPGTFSVVEGWNVTFDVAGGTPAPDAQRIAKNGTATEPTAPTKEGFEFGGWNNGTTPWDFDDTVTSDMTLTAQWSEAVAEVNGGYYATLEGAIEAAQDNDTITILKNFTIDASKTAATDRIVVNKAVTIDFGEYTMSVPGELEPTSNWAALYVDADTTITATTGGINCLDKESGGCGVYGINVRNGAKLTIEGGVYHGGGTIVQVQNGSAEIKGGTFTATAYDEPYGMNFVLNCIDASYPNEAAFDVSGGTFVGFDPQASKAEPGDPADLTAEGYVAIEDAEHPGTFSVVEGWNVTFDVAGGTPAPDAQRIAKNGTATEPTAPTKEGFEFGGWNNGTTPWDFDDTVTSDMTLTAKWNEAVASVKHGDEYSYFDTLQEALDAVNKQGTADTVTLLTSVSENVTVVSGQNVTLVLGTNKLTAEDATKPAILNNGILSVEGGTVINKNGLAVENSGALSLTDVNFDATTAIKLDKQNTIQDINVSVDGGTYRMNKLIDEENGIDISYDVGIEAGVFVGGTWSDGVFTKADMDDDSITPIPDTLISDLEVSGGFFSHDFETSYLAPGKRLAGTELAPYGEMYQVISSTKFRVLVSSEDTNKGTVTGSGSYPEGTTAIVTATPASSDFVFAGWYENGTLVSNSANYSFIVTARRTLVAKFVPSSSPSANVNLTVSATLFTITGFDNDPEGTVQRTHLSRDAVIGQTYTLTYCGTETFLYWENGQHRVMSRNKSFDFRLATDLEIHAVTSDTSSSKEISFVNYSDQVLFADFFSTDGTTTAAMIKVPAASTYPGGTFEGWTINGGTQVYPSSGENNVAEALAGLLKTSADTSFVVKAAYDIPTEKVTITINFVTVANGKVSAIIGNTEAKGKVGFNSITLDSIPAGHELSYWLYGDLAVGASIAGLDKQSTTNNVKIRLVSTDPITMTVVLDDQTQVQATAAIQSLTAKVEDGIKKLYCVAAFSLPTSTEDDTYKVVEKGILRIAGTENGVYLTLEDFAAHGAKQLRSTKQNTGTITNVFKLETEEDITATWCYRSYLTYTHTYKNGDGVEVTDTITVYSGVQNIIWS